MAAADRRRQPARSKLARNQAARDSKGRVCGSLPQLLSPEQERAVRAAWAAGATRDEAAAAAGVSPGIIRQRLADQLRDLPRRGRGGCRRRLRSSPPTPEEIAAMAAELRHGWTPERWLPAAVAEHQANDDERERHRCVYEDPTT